MLQPLAQQNDKQGEAPAAALTQPLAASARSAGFTPTMSVIEIAGLCSNCRKA